MYIEESRVGWVDYAKGFGIIFVVYGHVLRGINSANIGLQESFFRISDTLIYGFHMPLFFFISGLFAERWAARNTVKEAITEKIMLILWPYVLWSIIQGSINVIISSYTNTGLTWGNLVYGVLISPIGQFWFLYVLLIHYILFFVLYRWMKISTILLVSLGLYLLYPYLHFWVLDKVFGNFVYLCLGSYIYRTDFKLKDQLSGFINFIIISLIFLTLTISNIFYPNYFIGFGVALSGTIFILLISINLAARNSIAWIRYVGILSMPIYLLHILYASGFRIVSGKIFGVTYLSLHILLGVVIGVVFPIITYYITKRLGVEKITFGR